MCVKTITTQSRRRESRKYTININSFFHAIELIKIFLKTIFILAIIDSRLRGNDKKRKKEF